jgi:hypothetical protein
LPEIKTGAGSRQIRLRLQRSVSVDEVRNAPRRHPAGAEVCETQFSLPITPAKLESGAKTSSPTISSSAPHVLAKNCHMPKL